MIYPIPPKKLCALFLRMLYRSISYLRTTLKPSCYLLNPHTLSIHFKCCRYAAFFLSNTGVFAYSLNAGHDCAMPTLHRSFLVHDAHGDLISQRSSISVMQKSSSNHQEFWRGDIKCCTLYGVLIGLLSFERFNDFLFFVRHFTIAFLPVGIRQPVLFATGE